MTSKIPLTLSAPRRLFALAASLLLAVGCSEGRGQEPVADPTEALSAGERDRLRALGYVHEVEETGVIASLATALDSSRVAPGITYYTSARTCSSSTVSSPPTV